MNTLPLHHHSELSYGGRQIAFGLILRKRFIPEKYEQLVDQYREYIIRDKENEDFKKAMLIYLERTVDFLRTHNIETMLPD